MKKARLLLTTVALLFGLLIVFVSLVSTNQVVSFEGSQASNLKLYFGEAILPDHIVYPFVAAADRVLLWASPPQEKIKLQLAYSRIRMEYAQALLLKDEPILANHALTKSQKYVSLSALGYLDYNLDDNELKQEIIRQLETNMTQSREMIKEFSICQRPLVEGLNNNNQALLTQLLSN